MIYEVGSLPLSKLLYDVKGEFFKGERIYHVHHQQLNIATKKDRNVLRQLIQKLAEVFHVLSDAGVIHADIKPDNILVDFDG